MSHVFIQMLNFHISFINYTYIYIDEQENKLFFSCNNVFLIISTNNYTVNLFNVYTYKNVLYIHYVNLRKILIPHLIDYLFHLFNENCGKKTINLTHLSQREKERRKNDVRGGD